MLEELPDRCVLGTYVGANFPHRLRQLPDVLAFYRAALGQLSPAAAEKIAVKNARALLDG